jgi:hypothetical protein
MAKNTQNKKGGRVIKIGKPPAMPGDSKGLTFAGI